MMLPTPRFASQPLPKAGALGLALLISGTVFAGLAVAVVQAAGLPWDAPLLEFWHRHATPALDKMAVFLTIIGNTGPMVGLGLLVCLGLLVRRRRVVRLLSEAGIASLHLYSSFRPKTQSLGAPTMPPTRTMETAQIRHVDTPASRQRDAVAGKALPRFSLPHRAAPA